MPLSDYVDENLLKRLFQGQGTFPLPATLYVGLFTSAPTKAGGGTEVSGFGYARVAVPATIAYWNVYGPAWTVQNVQLIDFGQATGAGWGTILAAGIFDAASGGNLLYTSTLNQQKTVADGDPVVINIGSIQITGA